jgi:Rrf2 family protein
MFKISRETEYAIRGMIYLAKQPREQFIMVKEITKATNTSPVFVAKIFQTLGNSNLVISSRGMVGGFKLSRKPEHITLKDILEATEGPIAVNVCVVYSRSCSFSKTCSAHVAWKRIRDSINKMLEDITLKDIATGF